MRDEVIYRCVNMSCARLLPRRVNYCPYCGIGQSTALPRPQGGQAAAGFAADVAAGAAVGVGVDMAANISATASADKVFDAAARPVSIDKPAYAPAPAHAGPDAGAAAQGASTAPPAPPPFAAPAAPPQRQPIRLRWWLLALGALWLVWISQRPSAGRLDARVERAVALAQACKANEAQAELIALKNMSASTAQLARLQAALDQADGSCRHPGRGRAAAKGTARPAAASSQSVRNLLQDARDALARGDYRGAADKMEVCVAMVDPNKASTAECSALRQRAEWLDAARQRCLAEGGLWADDSCR